MYAVKEVYWTIQGEGEFAGTPAVFIRFAGCNVWSGRADDRERDTAKGCCAAWCDTDFVGTDGENGGHYTALELLALARYVARPIDRRAWRTIVFTGGEPALQLDDDLVKTLAPEFRLHVETNGSRPLPGGLNWVTLSPKPPMPVVKQLYSELKVIYPAVDPLKLDPWVLNVIPHYFRRYVQPQDGNPDALEACKRFIFENPGWQLSLQMHKLIGLR